MKMLWAYKKQVDESTYKTISTLLELIDQNGRKPTKIVLSRSAYAELLGCSYFDANSNWGKLFGINLEVVPDIEVRYE